ncbi:MAG: GNAT family N-acetyltransferase [Armatimonadetes bacterium]|nr:GNAT family N-acetyltransferase [Armatimonadota bacterium]
MSDVVLAKVEDIPAWLDLAREVEYLFGPMAEVPAFYAALRKNIDRGTAFCIREAQGPTGAALLGGMLYSPRPPIYSIGWLAVTQKCRRQGIGQRLMDYALSLVEAPAEMVVTTFGADNPDGEPARHFYEQCGFYPAEAAPEGSEGGSRQIFRRIIS